MPDKHNWQVSTAVDKARFFAACEASRALDAKCGIGTLGEKSLHALLKLYFEPDTAYHEVRVGRFVADICKPDEPVPRIIEIQTRSFDKLRNKLEAFLPCARVTVVYPIPAIKWLCWINRETAEITGRRKSPKRGNIYQSFPELYKIKHLLKHPNLTICFVLLELTEYRNLDGWSKDGKKGSSRYERIVSDIIDVVTVEYGGYSKLIPSGLEDFTTKDYAAAAGVSLSCAQTALNVLFSVSAVARAGKRGNLIVYKCVR